MKTNETAKKGLYVGVATGLIIFVLAGFFPGSLLGGAVGLQIIGLIYGGPMPAAILPKLILAVSMIIGILLAAVVYIIGTGLLGLAIGRMIESARAKAAAPTNSTVAAAHK